MGKGKGAKCPQCNAKTFHDKGSHSHCTSCGTIGWGWSNPVIKVGKGKGNICPNCAYSTLHDITHFMGEIQIRRCSTCNYSAIIRFGYGI